MTNDEIRAYNVGRRTHDDGMGIDAVYPGGIGPLLRPLRADDLDSVRRLGRDRFSEWAIRGWLDRARAAVG